MKIENYKGIDIMHDAKKDEFFTSIVILNKSYGKKDEVIRSPRLQKTRDEIDKFLNTASKKPVLKKAWYKEYDSYPYVKVDILLFNMISNTFQISFNNRLLSFNLNRHNDDKKLFICCKENDTIVKSLNDKMEQIKKIEKEKSCSSGKLIPLKMEHFE